MNTMSRCNWALAVALTATLCVNTPASAQAVRNFPNQTLRGTVVFGDFPQITLNGRTTRLSPGARVRDTQNRIVLAGALVGLGGTAHYTLDAVGNQVRDVWLLTPEETAIKPWPSTLEEIQTWTFNVTSKTWAKP
jgi:hypothetical protein